MEKICAYTVISMSTARSALEDRPQPREHGCATPPVLFPLTLALFFSSIFVYLSQMMRAIQRTCDIWTGWKSGTAACGRYVMRTCYMCLIGSSAGGVRFSILRSCVSPHPLSFPHLLSSSRVFSMLLKLQCSRNVGLGCMYCHKCQIS